jgi:hypothetical protein
LLSIVAQQLSAGVAQAQVFALDLSTRSTQAFQDYASVFVEKL